MSIVREVAQGYKAVLNLSHKQRVTRLYRKSLKLIESWSGDREVFLTEAAKIRKQFDDARNYDAGRVARLLREGEEKAAKFTHPDPYTVAYMPGGSKFMRNPPLPLDSVFASVGEVPEEYHIASQTVTCVQVSHLSPFEQASRRSFLAQAAQPCCHRPSYYYFSLLVVLLFCFLFLPACRCPCRPSPKAPPRP